MISVNKQVSFFLLMVTKCWLVYGVGREATDFEVAMHSQRCNIKNNSHVFVVRSSDDLLAEISRLAPQMGPPPTTAPFRPMSCDDINDFIWYNYRDALDNAELDYGAWGLNYLFNDYASFWEAELMCDAARRKRQADRFYSRNSFDATTVFLLPDERYVVAKRYLIERYFPIQLCSIRYVSNELKNVSIEVRQPLDSATTTAEPVTTTSTAVSTIASTESPPIMIPAGGLSQGEPVIGFFDTSLGLTQVDFVSQSLAPGQIMLSVSSEDGLSQYGLSIEDSNLAVRSSSVPSVLSGPDTLRIRGYQVDINHSTFENHAGGYAIDFDGLHQGRIGESKIHLSGNSTGIVERGPGGLTLTNVYAQSASNGAERPTLITVDIRDSSELTGIDPLIYSSSSDSSIRVNQLCIGGGWKNSFNFNPEGGSLWRYSLYGDVYWLSSYYGGTCSGQVNDDGPSRDLRFFEISALMSISGSSGLSENGTVPSSTSGTALVNVNCAFMVDAPAFKGPLNAAGVLSLIPEDGEVYQKLESNACRLNEVIGEEPTTEQVLEMTTSTTEEEGMTSAEVMEVSTAISTTGEEGMTSTEVMEVSTESTTFGSDETTWFYTTNTTTLTNRPGTGGGFNRNEKILLGTVIGGTLSAFVVVTSVVLLGVLVKFGMRRSGVNPNVEGGVKGAGAFFSNVGTTDL